MNDPTPFLWTFDESPHASNPLYETFSVGVYQLLPKSGGKGLKKSKTIRVLGYCAEPERAYEKAQALCDRLNAEKAMADHPPAWLQKQYSVSRPDSMVVEPRGDEELTGAQVRSIRQRVMARRLLPAGFARGEGGTYVRRQGGQIHLVDFQAHRWGHEFTVNLGFHYAFVPPFFRRARIALERFHPLDCALSARLGFFLPNRIDTWFPYGRDPDALAATFDSCAEEALRVLDDHAQRWADPAALLDWRAA